MLWEEQAEKYGADIERVQVWDALSEFYLDTELNETDLEFIAKRLADSPFSVEELRQIEVLEVAPVCRVNLWQIPGGIWTGFAADWLIPRCLQRQRATRLKPNALWSFIYWLMQKLTSYIPRDRISQLRAG
jgi:hypothetical protein